MVMWNFSLELMLPAPTRRNMGCPVMGNQIGATLLVRLQLTTLATGHAGVRSAFGRQIQLILLNSRFMTPAQIGFFKAVEAKVAHLLRNGLR